MADFLYPKKIGTSKTCLKIIKPKKPTEFMFADVEHTAKSW